MLMIERPVRAAGGLPVLVRVGLCGLAFAGLADLIAHLEVSGAAHTDVGHAHAPAEFGAHLAGFVSMVLIELGVVVDGVRRSRGRRGSADRIRKGVA